MQATKQQQIMGYFIEEAKEHLDTIEQGLLDLQSTMADAERLNELFRAAHSVKGGAAMLGLDGIHRVGHHLEDCFKILKDQPIAVDQHLENLFLKGFDTLKELVEGLQSPYGLRKEDVEQTVKAAEPTFTELQKYLDHCNNAANRTATKPSATTTSSAPKAESALSTSLNNALKLMLQLFKQGDTPASRQQLATLCSRMVQLSSAAEWRSVLQATHKAIANSKNSYQVLAPLIIKELKQAGDSLLAGNASAIAPSKGLLQLAAVAKPAASPSPAVPAATSTAKSPSLEMGTTKPAQITIPAEPRAAARALLDAFNKEQLIELAEFLMKAIQ